VTCGILMSLWSFLMKYIIMDFYADLNIFVVTCTYQFCFCVVQYKFSCVTFSMVNLFFCKCLKICHYLLIIFAITLLNTVLCLLRIV
jgi:hypothetical protein